jgi:osmotically-inducible protein OsmY
VSHAVPPLVGDVVLAGDPAPTPAGRIQRVLAARSGSRLLIARAFVPGSFLVAAAADVVSTTTDDRIGLRWHRLRPALAELLAGGSYRRTAGQLVPDPVPAPAPPPLDDSRAAQVLSRDLAEDPLVSGADVHVYVRHGVALLEGWVGTVGAKLVANRLGRTTAGVWDVVNRLVSDEELVAAVGSQIRADPRAAAVRGVSVELGRVTLTVADTSRESDERVLHRLREAVPGVRSVSFRAA